MRVFHSLVNSFILNVKWQFHLRSSLAQLFLLSIGDRVTTRSPSWSIPLEGWGYMVLLTHMVVRCTTFGYSQKYIFRPPSRFQSSIQTSKVFSNLKSSEVFSFQTSFLNKPLPAGQLVFWFLLYMNSASLFFEIFILRTSSCWILLVVVIIVMP